MMADSIEGWIEDAILSAEEGNYKRAKAEALIAIAYSLLCFLPDDAEGVPAGPILYEQYPDAKRC